MTKHPFQPWRLFAALALVGLALYTQPASAGAATNAPGTPSAIALLSFSAKRLSDTSAEVLWRTALEQDVFGFNLYRSSTGQRSDAVRINPNLIPAQGMSGGGASYRFVDATIQPGPTYFYWLQEVELDGGVAEFGPVNTAQVNVFAPFVAR
jgi:hypothetical protein